MDIDRFAAQRLEEWNTSKFGEADDYLYDKVRDDPEEAWTLIGRLVEAAPDEDSLDMIGAGPLEDLLCDHGPTFVDRVEARAQADDRFRRSLADVWGWNRLDPEVRKRLDGAVRVKS